MNGGEELDGIGFEEEKNRILGRVHMALAAESRAKQLRSMGQEEDELCKTYRVTSGLDVSRLENFLLEAVRRAPTVEQGRCYYEAVESVRLLYSWEDFAGAAKSGLAFRGEDAPVLSIALPADQTQTRSINSCQVTLLSGVSFPCSLQPRLAPAQRSGSGGAEAGSACDEASGEDEEEEGEGEGQGEGEGEADREASQKRPKLAGSEAAHDKEEADKEEETNKEEKPTTKAKSQTKTKTQPTEPMPLTVSDLTHAVLAELPKHAEAPPLSRVYIVFAGVGSDRSDVPMTPWDWNRPLTDFVA